MANAIRTGLSWARRILSFDFLPFSDNMNMGLLAVALSAVLWVFITNEQNPPRTGTFQSRIPVHAVNVPADLAAVETVEPVTIQITAPSDTWNSLTEGSFEATIDVAEASEGSVTRSVRVTARDARVRVLQVFPSTVTIEMDQLQRRTVPVKVNVIAGPPLGFSNQEPRIDVQQAVVLGPQRLVQLVQGAAVNLNLGNVRSTLRQSLPLVAHTDQGYEVNGVRIEPSQATVDVSINRHVSTVSLPVIAELTNQPAQGYWVSQVRTTPSVVTALAPQDTLQSVVFLKTIPIDISGATSSFSRRMSLALPQGVTLSDRSDVQVDVTILPLQSTATYQVAPQVIGTGTGLRFRTERPTVAVTIAGDAPTLNALNIDAIRVVLNIDGRGRGTHSITPQVTLPAGVRLTKLEPEALQVVVE